MLFAMPPAAPPAEVRPAPKPMALPEAEDQVLLAYDLREGKAALPAPVVSPKDRPALQWLLAAAEERLPANPFPKGSAHHREAEALRALYDLPPSQRLKRLKTLPLKLTGSHLALWTWGKALSRQRALDPRLRMAWEDRLLAKDGPTLTRSYALRHALCFALAEKDEPRFAALKARASSDLPELFQSFQKAFALLGGPGPDLHLWRLPELTLAEPSLAQLGARAFWVLPDGGETPALPEGTAWIVPTKDGHLPSKDALLQGSSLAEGKALAARLKREGRSAFLAPSRDAMEPYALCYFPILIRLDEQGTVQSILMGDAAPAKP